MINNAQTYHTPVMLMESLQALDIKPDGVYVDVTFGGGGHSKPILNQMNAKGRLFGFDQDEQAQSNLIDDSRFTFVQSNFRYLPQFMRYYDIESVDGILADLGVSSFHFDEPSRGFSYRFDADLDMRMNQSATKSAKNVLATYDQKSLQNMFSAYGEVRNSKSLSERICQIRKEAGLTKISDLLTLIDRIYIGDKLKYTSQVFQAIRIEVNDEIRVLESFLQCAIDLISQGGRLVVITYHSIEDAVVKNVFKAHGNLVDDYGRLVNRFKIITKKPIIPSEQEIKLNSRAASAKLRAIMKN